MQTNETNDLESAISTASEFDRDYYENGPKTGKSLYENYRWLPELSLKFAHKLANSLDIRTTETVLDYGCAKGYMVKAMRILDIPAYGCDISEYAISQADEAVKPYVKLSDGHTIPFERQFDWVVSKDVFEHVPKNDLDILLPNLAKKAENMFAIIPLAQDGKYICPEYELDKTHVIRENLEWWERKFEETGWTMESFSYIIRGMKDNWADYTRGNGFFKLSSKEILQDRK